MPSKRKGLLPKFTVIDSRVLASVLIVGSYVEAQVCTWNTVSSPNVTSGLISNWLSGVSAIDGNDVWAVGYNLLYPAGTGFQTLTEHWDGTQWTIIPSPNNGSSQLYGVASAGKNDVWAVGGSAPGSVAYPLVQHWDGTAWTATPLNIPNAGLNAVAVVSPSDVWAVGAVAGSSGLAQPLTVHWDGHVWTQVVAPTFNKQATLLGLSVVSGHEIWAVGTQGANHNAVFLKWDGTHWGVVQGPATGKAGGALGPVLALSSTNVWAGGQYHPSGVRQTLMTHWDGQNWSVDPSASGFGKVGSFTGLAASSPADVWAVGVVTKHSESQALLVHFGGASWSAVNVPAGTHSTWVNGVCGGSGHGAVLGCRQYRRSPTYVDTGLPVSGGGNHSFALELIVHSAACFLHAAFALPAGMQSRPLC
jgi:hypothetical protein